MHILPLVLLIFVGGALFSWLAIGVALGLFKKSKRHRNDGDELRAVLRSSQPPIKYDPSSWTGR